MQRNRKPNRLAGYDYSSAGVYFVTVCVNNPLKHLDMFGHIVDGIMILNEYGEILKNCWTNLIGHFENIQLDNYVVMPNHFHGIVDIDVGDRYVGARHAWPLQQRQYQKLPVIIGAFKSAATKLIRRAGLDHFRWQRSFHDRIIRDETELNHIREYVANNPIHWEINQDL